MYEGVVQDLIDELGRLPGVGPKSAQRIAFHILQADPADVRRLAHALAEVKEKVRFCGVCGNVAQGEQCRVCQDPRRDPAVICVVEEPKDVVAIERTREFRGRYHVLGGAISPIEGVGPDDLRIRELLARLADGAVTELILATDPNLEGEATATYLARMVKPMGLKVTRLASGLPVVAAQATGSESLVDDHISGRLIRPGAIHQYADALQAYVIDEDLRRRHGQAGEQRSLEFSWDRINQTVADTYLRLIRQKRRG